MRILALNTIDYQMKNYGTKSMKNDGNETQTVQPNFKGLWDTEKNTGKIDENGDGTTFTPKTYYPF